jgi:hypothetical protein
MSPSAISFYQIDFLSTLHFVNCTLYQLDILPMCHFINFTFSQVHISLTGHFVNFDISLIFHFANPPLRDNKKTLENGKLMTWHRYVSSVPPILIGIAHIRHQCRKTTVISYHRCLINIGVEKNEQYLSIYYNFDHQMSQ